MKSKKARSCRSLISVLCYHREFCCGEASFLHNLNQPTLLLSLPAALRNISKSSSTLVHPSNTHRPDEQRPSLSLTSFPDTLPNGPRSPSFPIPCSTIHVTAYSTHLSLLHLRAIPPSPPPTYAPQHTRRSRNSARVVENRPALSSISLCRPSPSHSATPSLGPFLQFQRPPPHPKSNDCPARPKK